MVPKSLIAECAYCEAQVDAAVKGTFEHFDPDTMDFPARTSLLQCPRCTGPLLVSEDILGSHGARDVYDEPYRLFPPRTRQMLGVEVPESIRRAVYEAERCLKAKAPTAAAIMCRKAMEGICVDQGQRKGSLAAKLKNLSDSGDLDPKLYEWADSLRDRGNNAAHDVESEVSREDATDLLALAVAVAEYVYTFRVRFDAFKQRRAAK